ncbi:MAG: TadE/TadG family type IV pilus assembly protein [Chloroflexota bacterium]
MAVWSRECATPGRKLWGIRGLPRHGQCGGALVEFVIIFPVLLMLLFGVWEFGRIFDAWLVSTNAAREGARYAISSVLTESEIQDKVLAYVSSGYGTRLNLGDVHIERSNIQVNRDPASKQVTVIVTAEIDVWAPAVTSLMGSNTFSVTAWSTMR